MDWFGWPGWIAVGAVAVVCGGLLAYGWRLLRRVRRDGPRLHRTVALIEVNVGVLGLIACVGAAAWLGFEWRRRAVNPRGKTAAEIVAMLQDRDVRVRLNALSWCKPPGDATVVVPGLIGALDDETEKVRLAAMKCLALWHGQAAEAAPRLAQFLAADPKSKEAGQAFYTLKRLGSAAGVAVEPLLRHDDPAVRDAALATLVKVEPLPVETFARQLAEAQGAVFVAVVRVVSAAEGDGALVLADALREQVRARTDPAERWKAAWALRELVDAALTDPALAEPLAGCLDQLLADTATGDLRWRERACRLLGALPAHAERTVPVLVAALQDERVANAACTGLEGLGPAGRAAIPALVAQLRIGRGRAKAVPALAAMGRPAADAVRAALEDPAVAADAVRREVLEAALARIVEAIGDAAGR